MMTEEFIHYLWRYQLIRRPLVCDKGDLVEVLATGIGNLDSGPDFLNARIRIGDTLWAGDVEIHVKSSDWHRHGHSSDPMYDGVILHVVHDLDEHIRRTDGQCIPSLVIRDNYDIESFERYEGFISSLGWISCERMMPEISLELWDSWISYLAVERINRRSLWVNQLYSFNHGHDEETFYHSLACGFGHKVNVSPFEWLAKSIDLKLVMKYQPDFSLLESLFFGQAGFLEEKFSDPYPLALAEQYRFLKRKHGLTTLPVHVWKFLRMRPAGFPTIKIAHWVMFLHHHADHLSALYKVVDGEKLLRQFEHETSPYWWNHYHFGATTQAGVKKMGQDTLLAIVLNGVVPFLYVRSLRSGDQSMLPEIITLLKGLSPENNFLVRKWRSLGIDCQNAMESQGLLELKSQFCDQKKCLDCNIGKTLLKGSK